jgi:hypothetical protein
MKDFAKSYEQKMWEINAKSHASLLVLLKNAEFDKTKEFAQQAIDKIEAKYPQLKNHGND